MVHSAPAVSAGLHQEVSKCAVLAVIGSEEGACFFYAFEQRLCCKASVSSVTQSTGCVLVFIYFGSWKADSGLCGGSGRASCAQLNPV